MTLEIAGPVMARAHGHGALQVKSIDMAALGAAAAPVCVFDEFRVVGSPFKPHPHAGFSAVSYIFGDSAGQSRSRDSLGGDYIVGPGGIVWAEAASGLIHEELPADPAYPIHGLQIFVNLGAANKLGPPRVLALDGPEVPEMTYPFGNRVRIVVGAHAGVRSPLVPAEPFDLLDLTLSGELSHAPPAGRNVMVYCVDGALEVQAGTETRQIASGQAMALAGCKNMALRPRPNAHVVLLSGLALSEPVVARGPFIMNSAEQIDSAMARYERGAMGALAPLV